MPLILLLFALLLPAAVCAQQIAWLWDGAALPAWSQAEAAVLQRHILLSGDNALTRPRSRNG